MLKFISQKEFQLKDGQVWKQKIPKKQKSIQDVCEGTIITNVYYFFYVHVCIAGRMSYGYMYVDLIQSLINQ